MNPEEIINIKFANITFSYIGKINVNGKLYSLYAARLDSKGNDEIIVYALDSSMDETPTKNVNQINWDYFYIKTYKDSKYALEFLQPFSYKILNLNKQNLDNREYAKLKDTYEMEGINRKEFENTYQFKKEQFPYRVKMFSHKVEGVAKDLPTNVNFMGSLEHANTSIIKE